MSHLKLRLLAMLASACMVVSITEAPRTPGQGLDEMVWTLAYALIALATAIVGIFPTRQTLRVWASLTIGTQLIRSVQVGFYPPLPEYRWGSVSANLFFGILAFFVWEGWRRRFDSFEFDNLAEYQGLEIEPAPEPYIAALPEQSPPAITADFSRHLE